MSIIFPSSLLHREQKHRILRFGQQNSLYEKQRTLRTSTLHVHSVVLPVSAAHCSRHTAQTDLRSPYCNDTMHTAQTDLRSPYCNDTMHTALTDVTLMAENVTSQASVLPMLRFINGNTYTRTYVVHTYTHLYIYT